MILAAVSLGGCIYTHVYELDTQSDATPPFKVIDQRLAGQGHQTTTMDGAYRILGEQNISPPVVALIESKLHRLDNQGRLRGTIGIKHFSLRVFEGQKQRLLSSSGLAAISYPAAVAVHSSSGGAVLTDGILSEVVLSVGDEEYVCADHLPAYKAVQSGKLDGPLSESLDNCLRTILQQLPSGWLSEKPGLFGIEP